MANEKSGAEQRRLRLTNYDGYEGFTHAIVSCQCERALYVVPPSPTPPGTA
jgi:hypothetical protein